MKKFIFVVIFLAVSAVIGWLGRPAYRGFKEKRFAAAAGEAWKAGEVRRALLSAQQALVLNSNNLAACRVMAELADGSRSPHAIFWRKRIAELEPTTENRLVVAACALRYEAPPFPIATETLRSVSAQPGVSNLLSFQLVSAQLALRSGRIPEAEMHFERAITLEPTNGLHRLNLAVVRLESTNAAKARSAREELERLQSTPEWSAAALRSLVVHHAARRQFAEAAQYSSRLMQHTNATFGDRLEHLSILHGAKDPGLEAFAGKLRGDAATNALQVSDLIHRLISIDRAESAWQWAATLPAAVREEQPVPLAEADALMALKRWRPLEQALSGQRWGDREFLRQAILAFAIRQQGESEAAAAHWKDAAEQALVRSELTATLAQIAVKWNWTNEVEALLWRAVEEFPKELWPIQSLESSYTRMRHTRGLLEVNTALLARNGSNVVAQNNFAALALLLGTNTARAHQLAEQVYRRDTNSAAFVSTYAFSLHRQGRTAEALKLIETLRPEHLAHPAVAGYYGVLLAANGQKAKAREYFAKAENAPILPEELQMIAEARRGL